MTTIKELRNIKEEVIKDYLEEKLSQREIAKKYNTFQVTIQKLLKENCVNARKNTEANRAYFLNVNYFDKIDTINKAYILGFLYADGCNNKKYRTIKLTLQDIDKDILEEIRKEIGSERPLGLYEKHSKNKNHKNAYELVMQSEHMCETLEQYGMTPRKSLTLQFPMWMKEDLYSHFIRGYFDGDGHISNWRGAQISIVSSMDFCNALSNFFSEKLPDARQKVINVSTNTMTGRVISSDKDSVKILMDYIYKDCNNNDNVLFMKRKHEIYLKKFYPELLNQDLKRDD